MSVIEEPRGHRAVIEGLWHAHARGRLPHSLLFEGPAGIGKFQAARWFAQGVHCEARELAGWDGPCGVCGACKRFAAGSHPDVYVLDPLVEEMEVIPVKAVAERERGTATVCGFFALRAMEGGMRTVIVREFERAEAAAQNALLKTLEEPGDGALLILETSRTDLLLETIRSRCVTVRFDPLNVDDCTAVLYGTAANAEEIVRWAHGSPGRAQDLVRQGAPAAREILAAVLRGSTDPFAASTQLQECAGEFHGKTPTAKVRARTRAALDLLLAVLADGVRHGEGLPLDGLAHADLAPLAAGQRLAWVRALERVVALRGEVELNLSPEGILDRALLALPASSCVPQERHA